MGYDVSARARAGSCVAEYDGVRDELPSTTRSCCAAELTVLATFADLCELSRNRPAGEEEEADERVHSPREYFHAYLHSLDVEREGLPEAFRARLAAALRALRRHRPGARPGAGGGGVPGLPGPAAHRRPDARSSPALLERWRSAVPPAQRRHAAAVAEVVERLVVATQLRYPAVGDLARSVRYRLLRGPVIQADPARSYSTRPRELLAELTAPAAATPTEYADRIEALVASPEPLIRLLAEQLDRERPRPGRDARGDDPAVLPEPRPAERHGVRLIAGRPYVTGRLRAARRTGWS